MEKYWLTGADSKSVTFLVMATVHYSGLRGVHTEVDCVPKGWHSCQQHLQCIFTPTMSMQKEKEWRDFACIPNCWGMRTSLQPALDRKTTLRFLWGLRALQSVSEEMEISLNSKHLFKAISGPLDSEFECATGAQVDANLRPIWRVVRALCSRDALLPCVPLKQCNGQQCRDTAECQRHCTPAGLCWMCCPAPCQHYSASRTALWRASQSPCCKAAASAFLDQATLLYW